jgi:hypothetical protein
VLTIDAEYLTSLADQLNIPHATSIRYELTLIGWREISKLDHGLTKKASGRLLPSGVEFYSVHGPVIMGTADVPEAIDLALGHMKKNEHCLVHSPVDFAFGNFKQSTMPPFKDAEGLEFEIELLDFINMKESSDMDHGEKLQDGEKSRLEGNAMPILC